MILTNTSAVVAQVLRQFLRKHQTFMSNGQMHQRMFLRINSSIRYTEKLPFGYFIANIVSVFGWVRKNTATLDDAFLAVSRKKGSAITEHDFQQALESFGLAGDKGTALKLFNLYDWRQAQQISFQVSGIRQFRTMYQRCRSRVLAVSVESKPRGKPFRCWTVPQVAIVCSAALFPSFRLRHDGHNEGDFLPRVWFACTEPRPLCCDAQPQERLWRR